MKKAFLSGGVVLALLTAAPGAHAQQAAATLTTAQSIALGQRAGLAGSVRLANHNTVLLLTDAERPVVRVLCLRPNGQTAWEATLTRYQRIRGYSDLEVFPPAAANAKSSGSVSKSQREADQRVLRLDPMEVFTNGNELVAVETIAASTVKRQPKGGTLREGQVVVQRLSEQGQLTQALFEPDPAMANKKTEFESLARYADDAGFVEVMRESNKRESSLGYFTYRYDLGRKTVAREPLPLPATPNSSSGKFRHWYQDWAYLGHRPHQTYFVRRRLTDADQPKQEAGDQPLQFEVYIVDDQGRPAGGFATSLGLPKGTGPSYSGNIETDGEMYHIPSFYTVSNGRSTYTYDEWDVSTGGVGSFTLDYATGDVLIVGEYGEGELPATNKFRLGGCFQRRYSSTGQALAQVQVPYTDAMRDGKRGLNFVGHLNRQPLFYSDPLTGQSQYIFGTNSSLITSANIFFLYFDPAMQMQHYDFQRGEDRKAVYTTVYYSEPFWLSRRPWPRHKSRTFEHANAVEHPVYAALERLQKAAAATDTRQVFHLNATGTGTGLIVCEPLKAGSSLQVYTF